MECDRDGRRRGPWVCPSAHEGRETAGAPPLHQAFRRLGGAVGRKEGGDADSLVVALPQVGGGADGMQGAGAGLVKAWSIEDAAGGARIKLDLVRPAEIKRRFLLAPGDGVEVYRYVIDLAETADAAP